MQNPKFFRPIFWFPIYGIATASIVLSGVQLVRCLYDIHTINQSRRAKGESIITRIEYENFIAEKRNKSLPVSK